MSYVRTVAHQVGTFALLCMTALGAGCADSPTSIPDAAPLRATTLDPALALSGGNLIGQRVSTDRYVQVFSLPSRQSAQLGQQRNGIRGTIVNGPSPLTSTNPYPLYQVNFDSGPDGWVLGVYLSLLAPLPPTPPPTAVSVASVAISPASAVLAVGGALQLTALVRDSAGNTLAGRTVTWTSSNGTVAAVAASGMVTALAAGSATITGTTGGRAGTSAITAQAVVTPPPPPPPPPTLGNAYFASRWTTATGATQSAFLDTGSPTPWGFVCCSSNTNTTITTAAALGLQDWPGGSNVYRVGVQSGSGIQTHQLVADLGAPAANSHRYFRYYLQVAYGDDHGSASESSIEHGVETSPSTSGGGRGLNMYRLPRNDGTWFPAFRDIASGWRYVASDLRLAKNRTYRWEWHVTYLASTYSLQIRIYDGAGVLVATENDFFQLLPSRNTAARLGAAQFAYAAADHRFFRVGTNGPGSNFPLANLRTDNLFLHGAVAVCATGWCGPVAP